jgi:O-antigen ligase
MLYFLEALFILAPTYVLRFKLLGLPLNALEILILVFWLIFSVWLWRSKLQNEFLDFVKKHSKIFLTALALFFIAGAISSLISPAHQRAVGLFIVQIFMPILTYFPTAYILQNKTSKYHFIKVMLVIAGLYGIYAFVQYYTLIGVPPEWWGNSVEPKRALAVFEYPNAYALWITPVLAFTLPFLFDREFNENKTASAAFSGLTTSFKATFLKISWVLGLVGLVFSLSRSGWAGLFAAAVAFAVLSVNKRVIKYLIIGLIPVIIVIYALPNLRYRLILPFKGDKSTLSRFSLWHTADKMIADSPITGKGLYGFRTLYDKYNTDSLTVAYDYPHNIFLNFWLETGLLGLLSFLLINAERIFLALKNRNNIFNIAVILFIVAIFIHGLFDAPYFKNDLALEFWMIFALAK